MRAGKIDIGRAGPDTGEAPGRLNRPFRPLFVPPRFPRGLGRGMFGPSFPAEPGGSLLAKLHPTEWTQKNFIDNT